MTAMTEDVLIYNAAQSLVGVLTTPADNLGDEDLPVVILLNGGLVHRVGPNRLYVKIARSLAAIGLTVLRLDLANIGDSPPRAENMPVEQSMLSDVRDAMASLERTHGARRFIMMGHCAGGMMSLLVVEREARVAGAVLITPLGVSEEWAEFDRKRKEASYYANFYGRDALKSGGRWRRVLTGQADYRTIFNNLFKYVIRNFFATLFFRARTALGKGAATDTGAATSEQAQLRAILSTASERGTRLLFIHDQGSSGLDYFNSLVGPQVDQMCAAGLARVEIIPESDHLFSLVASQQQVVDLIQTWSEEFAPKLQLSQ